jgi:hypothetical protein
MLEKRGDAVSLSNLDTLWLSAYPRLWRLLYVLARSVETTEETLGRVHARYRRKPRRYRTAPALWRLAYRAARGSTATPGDPGFWGALPDERVAWLLQHWGEADRTAAYVVGRPVRWVRRCWSVPTPESDLVWSELERAFAQASGRWDHPDSRRRRPVAALLGALAAVLAAGGLVTWMASRPPLPFGGLVPPAASPQAVPPADRPVAAYAPGSDPLLPAQPLVGWASADRPWLLGLAHLLITGRPLSERGLQSSAPLLLLQLPSGEIWGVGLALADHGGSLAAVPGLIAFEQPRQTVWIRSPTLYRLLTRDRERLFPTVPSSAWNQVTVSVSPAGYLRLEGRHILAGRLVLYLEPLQAGFSSPIMASFGPPTPASYRIGAAVVRAGSATWQGWILPPPGWRTYLPVNGWALILEASGSPPVAGLAFGPEVIRLNWTYTPPVTPIDTPTAAVAALPQLVAAATEGNVGNRASVAIQVPEAFPFWPSRPGTYRITWTGLGAVSEPARFSVTATPDQGAFLVTASLTWAKGSPGGLHALWVITPGGAVAASAGNVG